MALDVWMRAKLPKTLDQFRMEIPALRLEVMTRGMLNG